MEIWSLLAPNNLQCCVVVVCIVFFFTSCFGMRPSRNAEIMTAVLYLRSRANSRYLLRLRRCLGGPAPSWLLKMRREAQLLILLLNAGCHSAARQASIAASKQIT